MEIVIDKANVLSFLSCEDKNAIFECTRLIKRGIQLCFNFNKEEICTQQDNKILMWLSTMTQGLKVPLPKWEPRIDSLNIKTNFTTTLSAKQKRDAYLLNNGDIVSKIREKGSILIGSIGEEIELLLSLNIEDTETATNKITSWQEYCPKLPLTDIIICDNHFFKDFKIYQKNRDDLIKGISQLPQQSPVNCVIIFKIDQVDNRFDLNKEVENIKNSLKKLTKSTKSSATIIGTYSTHDRNVITNYYRIKNGSCFHLNDNGLKEDVTTEIKSHANESCERRSNQLLELYQKIIDNSNGKNIFGDKKCNFLNF